MEQINWEYGTSHVSTHFTVRDLIYLPQWARLANESDGLTEEVKHNLINLAAKMEMVRHYLNDVPIISHCGYRPTLYNALVKGAPHSEHLLGCALDFNVEGMESAEDCLKVRQILLPKLEEFGLRCENREGIWIHLDTGTPHSNRYFIP